MQDNTRHRSPAIQQLIADLTRQIQDGTLRPGDYLPSAHELASRYGIGYVSVIRAYKTLRNAGLIETVQGRGAFVHGTARHSLDTVCVILPDQTATTEVGNPHSAWVFQELLAGMNAATLAHRINLQLLFADAIADQWQVALDRMGERTAVLFVLQAPPPWAVRLLLRHIPCGLVLPHEIGVWENELPHAYMDYYEGMYAAVTGALAGGRTRVVFLGDPDNRHEAPRYAGFMAAMRDHGAGEVELLRCEDISREAGYQTLARNLDDAPRAFDLLVAGNDLRALGAMDALAERKTRVPEDVAVIGFDNIPAAETAGLTTVQLPIRALGEQSIHWIQSHATATPTARSHELRLPCPVIWRHTTGEPPHPETQIITGGLQAHHISV